MATNRRLMPVTPEAVWRVLADPDSYGYWVVGSKYIRDADADFPAPGSKFHHAIGVGFLTLRDHTEVMEAVRPRRMRLRAKGRPLGTATVLLELTRENNGTCVRMTEYPDGLFAPLRLFPPVHVAIKVRNAESLTRLEELALRRS